MKRALSVLAMAMLVAAGCGSDGGGSAATSDAPTPRAAVASAPPAPAAQSAMPTANVARANAAATPKPAAGPVVPAGARYTIYCDTISTDDHVARSIALRDALAKNARARDWYIIHQAGESSIYHGYYKETDPKAAGDDRAARADAQRALADKAVVDALPSPTSPGRKLFPGALFVPLDAPDPTAPPEWSLTNAPGYWSVQVAAFTGADRKANAVEAVRAARAMGVTAYYFHGPSVSSVCVNSWPAEAIKRQQAADGQLARSEDETVVVNLTGNELTPEERRALEASGRPIREFAARVEILDPSLKATLAQYPEHAVDGAVQMTRRIDRKTGKEVLVPRPSMIVPIPRGNAAMNVAGNGEAGAEPNLPPPPIPMPPSGADSNLNARLRGIGR